MNPAITDLAKELCYELDRDDSWIPDVAAIIEKNMSGLHKTCHEQMATLSIELDKMRGSYAHISEALEACEKASGFVPCDTPLPVWIAGLCERAEECEKVKAHCAFLEQQNAKTWESMQTASDELARAREECATKDAACASFCSCLDSLISAILEHANANMLNMPETKTNISLPDGQPIQSSVQTMSGMPSSCTEKAQSRSSHQEEASGTVEKKETKQPQNILGILKEVQFNTPGQEQIRLREKGPLQGKMQNNAEKCGCSGKDCETSNVRDLWVENRAPARASRRLQQAINRAMDLQNLSREEALQIVNAISSDAGKATLEKIDRLRGMVVLLLNELRNAGIGETALQRAAKQALEAK